MQAEDFPAREFDEEFVRECEQAIIDRDEKIKVLLAELALKPSYPDLNASKNEETLAKIEKSLFFTRKKFGKLQKWFENFEEKKLRKTESKNCELRQENTLLQQKQQNFTEKKMERERKTNSFLINLKKDLKEMKEEIQDVKDRQRQCGKIVNFCVEKTKEKVREYELAKNKPLKIANNSNSGGYLTPDEKTKKKSENTVSTKSSQNQELKSEYHRKSTIIQCILKSLNQKNVMEKLKNTKKNKVFSLFFLF